MNRLRFLDEAGRVVGEVALGALALDLAGAVGACAIAPASLPTSARSAELIEDGRIVGAGPIAAEGST